MSSQANPIGNMNIATFIKEIYMVLKNLDDKYFKLSDVVEKRFAKIEANYINIKTTLETIQDDIASLHAKFDAGNSLKTDIGLDLESQMKILNNNINTNIIEKLELNSKELTVDNLIENNYSVNDIAHVIIDHTNITNAMNAENNAENNANNANNVNNVKNTKTINNTNNTYNDIIHVQSNNTPQTDTDITNLLF